MQVKSLADEIGVSFIGMGFQPKWAVEDTPAMPKARTFVCVQRRADCSLAQQGRYKIMREYMPKVGSMGLDSMFQTAAFAF